MNKLNLAVFNTQPPHLYFGGVERRIVETAKSLHNQVETTVYSGTKAGFRKPTTINGTRIVPCFSTDALFPVDNWFFNNTLAGAVNTINADVYEAHAVSGYGFLRALKEKGIIVRILVLKLRRNNPAYPTGSPDTWSCSRMIRNRSPFCNL